MRILFVSKYPPICGGVSNSAAETAKNLNGSGHSTMVISNPSVYESTRRHLRTENREDFPEYSQRGYVHSLSANTLTDIDAASAVHFKPDLIVGWYLYPYAALAKEISVVTGVPLAVIHAGSDLFLHKDAKTMKSIFEALRHARRIVSADSPAVNRQLVMLGAEKRRLKCLRRGFRVPEYFDRGSFTKGQTFEGLDHAIAKHFFDAPELLRSFRSYRCSRSGAGPRICFYGKVSPGKNWEKLLNVLRRLAQERFDFEIVAAIGGRAMSVRKFFANLNLLPELKDRTTIFPLIERFAVARLLSTCDIGVCLENDFQVSEHVSMVPREMLASGLALVVSNQIASKPFYRWILRDQVNAVFTATDVEGIYQSLRMVLQNAARREEIANAGLRVSEIVEASLDGLDGVSEILLDL